MSSQERKDLLRLALTPRWILAAVLLVLFVIVVVLLGRWQWERTQAILASERASQSQPIPLQEVYPEGDAPTALPDDGVGRPVTAVGEFTAGQQVVVTGREHEGGPGVWVVTAMRLDDGRSIAVLRGSLGDADAAGIVPPIGPVAVSGVLQPDEGFYANAASAPGTVASIAHDRLAELWGQPLLPGFVVLSGQEPASTPAPTPVQPTIDNSDVAFPLQNFFYAFQWWLIGIFALMVFGRWLWLESRDRRTAS